MSNKSPYIWTGEIPAQFHMDDALKAFQEKIMGHIRREFKYRAFAVQLLGQLPALCNTMTPESAKLLTEVIGVWKTELDNIAKL